MLKASLFAGAAAFSIRKTYVQDAQMPECAGGIRWDPTDVGSTESVCLPAYCKEASDYDCEMKNGQAAGKACCLTKVQGLICEKNAEDPYCYKKCSDTSAPCSLGVVEAFTTPEETSASADCGN